MLIEHHAALYPNSHSELLLNLIFAKSIKKIKIQLFLDICTTEKYKTTRLLLWLLKMPTNVSVLNTQLYTSSVF